MWQWSQRINFFYAWGDFYNQLLFYIFFCFKEKGNAFLTIKGRVLASICLKPVSYYSEHEWYAEVGEPTSDSWGNNAPSQILSKNILSGRKEKQQERVKEPHSRSITINVII